MSMLYGDGSLGGPGTYVVTVYEEKVTVEADSIEFPADGGLKVWKDGVVTGIFSWYTSIVRKPDKS